MNEVWLESLPSVDFLRRLWPAGVLDPRGVLSILDFGVNTDVILLVGVLSATAGVISAWGLVVRIGVCYFCSLSGVPEVKKVH